MKISSVTLAAACAAALAGCSTIKKPAYDTLICHRGESKDAPENTLPAYRMAVERGFGFECDIYLSTDKRLFTFHDGTLKRTTNGAHTEKCTEASWADTVSKVNVGGWGKWKDSKFDPTRPALLEEVLELARDGRYIYVEVKGNDPSWVPYIKEVFEKQKKATPKNVLFITFGDELCAELKRQMPEYKAYWLTGARRRANGATPAHDVTAEEVIAKLRETGADGVDISFIPDVITEDFVKTVKAAGYEVHMWTIDDLAKAKLAFSRGAQTVTTNCAKKLLDEYNSKDSLPSDGCVFTSIDDCAKYESLHPMFAKAFEFLRRPDLNQLACGRYEIDGSNCWAMVQEAKLKPCAEENRFEVHREFIDIQMPISGEETFGSIKPTLETLAKFDGKRDCVLFQAKGDIRTLKPREIAIFFPETGAHAPCMSLTGPRTIRKVVIKVRK